MPDKRKLTFTHPATGEKFTRTTDRDYTHVSFGKAGNKDTGIRWHHDATSAHKRGNAYPIIESTQDRQKRWDAGNKAAAQKVKDNLVTGNYCTVTTGSKGQTCGRQAVTSFHSNSSGETFFECEKHRSD